MKKIKIKKSNFFEVENSKDWKSAEKWFNSFGDDNINYFFINQVDKVAHIKTPNSTLFFDFGQTIVRDKDGNYSSIDSGLFFEKYQAKTK